MRQPPSISECAFCRIVRGDAPAELLYANARAIAILDINPIHYGHVLVIPKTHCPNFVDLHRDDLHAVSDVVQVVSRAIVGALQPPGFNIFSNNGRAAGQSVFHFHFHITPRYEDDDIQFILKLKKYTDCEMTVYGDRLRQQISQLP
jgi:histidine triad (HIT) family protein